MESARRSPPTAFRICEDPVVLVENEIGHLPPKGRSYEPPPDGTENIPIYGPNGMRIGTIEHTEHVPVPGCCEFRPSPGCVSPVSVRQCKEEVPLRTTPPTNPDDWIYRFAMTCNPDTARCKPC